LAAERPATDRSQPSRPLPPPARIGLTILLVAACFLIVQPFLPLIAWGIIIAVASYPSYLTLRRILGGRGGLAAALYTLLFLSLLIVPVILLGHSIVQGVATLTERLKSGTAIIPPPPPSIQNWPLIGSPLNRIWSLASTNITAAVEQLSPQIKAALPGILSASAGLGFTVLQLFLAILVSGALLANGEGAEEVAVSLTNRIFGEKGPEFHKLIGSTIRSVTLGILGVALIQSVCAAVGFLMVDLPGAGLWAITFLVAAVLQVGGLVLVPAVIYAFAFASTTKAVVFMVWCLFVGLMDNVLKPLLLGRGAAVPMLVIFLGAIGGFVAVGIIGLFVGAIVLSVGYKLFIAWLEGPPEAAAGSLQAGS